LGVLGIKMIFYGVVRVYYCGVGLVFLVLAGRNFWIRRCICDTPFFVFDR